MSKDNGIWLAIGLGFLALAGSKLVTTTTSSSPAPAPTPTPEPAGGGNQFAPAPPIIYSPINPPLQTITIEGGDTSVTITAPPTVIAPPTATAIGDLGLDLPINANPQAPLATQPTGGNYPYNSGGDLVIPWSFPTPITEDQFNAYSGTTEDQRELFVATHPEWNNGVDYEKYRVYIAQRQHGIAPDVGPVGGSFSNIPADVAEAYISSIGGVTL